MLTPTELRNIAEARLDDAELLFAAGRLDGAFYLCGYAIELALKARVCLTLNWAGYPETTREFQDLQSFRTHNLDVLLHLSGVEQQIKVERQDYATEWRTLVQWNPEIRYRRIGSASSEDVQSLISAAKVLLEALA
jgi:HEPN domain-containing protein